MTTWGAACKNRPLSREHSSVHISGDCGSLIMYPDQFRVTLSSFHAFTLSENVDEVVYFIYFVSICCHYSYYYLRYLISYTRPTVVIAVIGWRMQSESRLSLWRRRAKVVRRVSYEKESGR